MSAALILKAVPLDARKLIPAIPLSKIIHWIAQPGEVFNASTQVRDAFLIAALEESVSALEKKLGPDMSRWQYGQLANHHVLIKHPFSNAVDDSIRKKLDAGPLPRGGYGSTVGMTSNNDNQQAGASFRMVVDLSDWEKAMFTNAPGQSGDPTSHYYKNLFEPWANDRHFPVYFKKENILQSAHETLLLNPE